MTVDNGIKYFINLLESNKLDECFEELSNAKKNISDPVIENLYGIVLVKKLLHDDAIKQFKKTIELYPNFIDAYYNLGTILLTEKNYFEAENYLRKAVNFRDNYYDAIFNLANVLRLTHKEQEAIDLYLKCKNIRDNDFEVYNCLGLCFQNLRNYKLAIEHFNKAISINFDAFGVYNNLALIYYETQEYDAAIRLLDRAININPLFTEAYLNFGNIYRELKNFEKSKLNYEKAISLDNKLYKAYFNLAKLKIDLKKDYFGAIDDLNYTISLNTNYQLAHSLLATCYVQIFNHSKATHHFEKSLDNKNNDDLRFCITSYIFYSNYFLDFSQEKYFSLTKILNEDFSANTPIFNTFQPKQNSKIKIGFFSADFNDHAVSFQIIEFIKLLSKNEQFEIYGFYNNLKSDEITFEFKKYFKNLFNLFLMSDLDILSLVRSENLDIAFDLSGYTKGNLLNIFSYRIAKKQITWCGYLQSTGIKNMDFILGDRFVFPKEEKILFSESKLELENCWTNLKIPVNLKFNRITPSDEKGYITFGCFNNLAKINEPLLQAWAKILLSVENSILYLKNANFKNSDYINFLFDKFEKLGINKNKLLFEKNSPRDELLNCYNKIDIALDTYPYNGGTTTLEAYSMCVPVLTLVGDNFVSRCGYSINSNLNLNDWSCFSYDEYINKGIEFAKNNKLLNDTREYLFLNRSAKSVLNPEKFTKDFIKMLTFINNQNV
jgi:predicted O-linked N-acetylglucosamine transferase (SPINDLY family)